MLWSHLNTENGNIEISGYLTTTQNNETTNKIKLQGYNGDKISPFFIIVSSPWKVL